MKVVKKRADMHLNSHPIIFLDLFVCVCVLPLFFIIIQQYGTYS